MKFQNAFIGTGIVGLFFLSGCKSFEDYQNDRIAYAVKHFERARFTNLKQNQILTIQIFRKNFTNI